MTNASQDDWEWATARQNRRVEYVKAYFQVVNWDFVSGQFAQKASRRAFWLQKILF